MHYIGYLHITELVNARRMDHLKYPLLLSDFIKLELPRHILVTSPLPSPISNLPKILLAEADMFHADGRADRYEYADTCVSQLCKIAKK